MQKFEFQNNKFPIMRDKKLLNLSFSLGFYFSFNFLLFLVILERKSNFIIYYYEKDGMFVIIDNPKYLVIAETNIYIAFRSFMSKEESGGKIICRLR